MATQQEKVDFIINQIAGAGKILSRKMFGEYCIYCNDKVVALVCDNHLFVTLTSISSKYLDESHHAPAYPGAKDSIKIPDDKLKDKAWLTELIFETQKILPLSKKKKGSTF